MGQLLSLVASCYIIGRIGGNAKALVLVKVMSEGDERIIVHLSNIFQTQQSSYYTKQKKFHQEYEKLFTGSEKITITGSVQEQYPHRYNDGYTVQPFKHSGGEKVADESVKSTTDGCILFTVILLNLFS